MDGLLKACARICGREGAEDAIQQAWVETRGGPMLAICALRRARNTRRKEMRKEDRPVPDRAVMDPEPLDLPPMPPVYAAIVADILAGYSFTAACKRQAADPRTAKAVLQRVLRCLLP